MRQETTGQFIVDPKESGYSDWYNHPGHGRGRFNFDVEPENAGGVGGTRYAFDTEDGGRWFLPIEASNQGMRWEEAEHAESDYDRYHQMDPIVLIDTMRAMWGESPVGDTVLNGVFNNWSFGTLQKYLKDREMDTWRSISESEPEP